MKLFDLTFKFGQLSSTPSTCVISGPRGIDRRKLQVSIDDSILRFATSRLDAQLCADLLSIAGALHAADGLAKRRADSSMNIRVSLPIWNIEKLSKPEVKLALESCLQWLTGDCWTFDWNRRTSGDLRWGMQLPLLENEPNEVCLWSGGLDSLLGLICRSQKSSSHAYTLVGTGSSDPIFGRQKIVHDIVKPLLHQPSALLQVPINLIEAAGLRKNDNQRSRGFVFMLVGCVVAHLQRRESLSIYENGIGAMNLPYCATEVELDHSRSVHPRSLGKVGDLVSLILDTEFRVHNHFFAHTKGNMVMEARDLLKENLQLVAATTSCDSRHRQKDQPPQCGYCTSCLMRRYALLYADVADETDYALFNGHTVKPHDGTGFLRMRRQALAFRNCCEATQPWQALVQEFPNVYEVLPIQARNITPEADHAARDVIMSLVNQYAVEWLAVDSKLATKLAPRTLLSAA